MNGYEFCCWFRGVIDMSPEGLTADQIDKVRAKLATVKSPQELMALANQGQKPKRPDDFVARC